MFKNRHGVYWKCQCRCGGEVTVESTMVIYGNTKSCGCLKKETARQNCLKRKTHGMKQTREYQVWCAIIQRCNNPNNKNYNYYGGRGIHCKDWIKFENFFRDMGPIPIGMTIERINNDGPYCKSNCKFADKYTQANNRRSNKRFVLNGISRTLTEWARDYNVSPHLVLSRINKGWDLEKALNQRPRFKRQRKERPLCLKLLPPK